MPKPVPTPLAAALGLVPTVLDGARRLPGKAVQLPVLAVSSALTALDNAKREYDELAGRGEKLVSRLRGGSLDAVEDRLEDAVAKVSDLLDKAAERKPSKKATPRIDTAASPEVVQAVEQVAATVTAPTADHADLPLADYDHMTLGSLRGRLRSLSVAELVQVRDYEKAHADRLPVVTLLDNRIAKLASDVAAPPAAKGKARAT